MEFQGGIMDKFYRYIYKQGNGYRIIYQGEHYGWYDDLATCLYDRDRLEAVDWDIQTWTELPEVPNPYKHIRLPEYHRGFEHIVHLPERWRVQRRINGKVKYFGTYDSLEEAEERVLWLDENGWN